MLSRVANHTYWLGRYLERAEDMARALSVHDLMLMDLSEFDRDSMWHQLVAVNGNEELFTKLYKKPSEKAIVQFLVSSPDNPSSITSSLNGARYNLRACRSTIPKAMYELVNEVCLSVSEVPQAEFSHSLRRLYLRQLENQLLAIAGSANGSMSYNKAFLFMRIGCFLERADMTSRILDVRTADLLSNQAVAQLSAFENSQWIAILQSLQAYQMYMSETRRPINGPDVLNFVLKNLDHPKSFRFCVQRLSSFIQRLPDTERLQEQVDKLLNKVDSADVHQLAKNQSDLHQFIDELQVDLGQFGQDFSDHFFPVPEQVQKQSQGQK